MKRLLSLLIILSVLGVGLLLSLTLFIIAKNEFQAYIDQQVDHTHQQVRERFQVFDELIANDERELHKQARRALKRVTDIILHDNFKPEDWSPERLQQLSDQYNVDAIYVIDRSTKVVATNFLPDLGFNLGTISKPFNDYLSKLYGTGRLEVDRINVSSKTGILQIYAYYAPLGSDYIVEVSYDVKKYLIRSHSSRYVDFMFGDFFTELSKSSPLLDKVDIYLVNNYAAFPFLQDTPNITAQELPVIPEKGVLKRQGDDNTLYHFSRADLNRSNLHSADYLAIRSTINLTPMKLLLHKFLGISLIVIVITLTLGFILITYLFDKWILRRIFRIIAALERSAEGDYRDQLSSEKRDELGLISDHINSMNKRIARRDEELREARDYLELRVEERTSDLQLEIEARIEAEKKLKNLASTDPLTGVMNRRAFDEQAHRELANAKRHGRELTLILLDLDHFKSINDKFGHQFGDQVLIKIAELIQPCLRATDSLCRHGGEEFIIILPETDIHNAKLIAERLRLEIENAVISNQSDVNASVTASLGVAQWADDEKDILPSIHRADEAMYQAKQEGRNRVVVSAHQLSSSL
ncbi:diguanylate cyclase [uncultured Neptuniibacter sp.]|uniref:diguanylate cyclase n=1 Tax=uncultured Neptuniibacter sp. TaxID=502143 RepID=UPI00261707CB|nr:diguanylate cyclase [uncultured Neptuniibacter sp.]